MKNSGIDPSVIKKVDEKLRNAGIKAMRIEMEKVLTEAIDLTPVDTGTLRRSGTVTVGELPPFEQVHESAKSGSKVKFTEPLSETTAVYVSFNTPYAKYQHEETLNHPRGGQAKYLEQPFESRKGDALKAIAAAIGKALEG